MYVSISIWKGGDDQWLTHSILTSNSIVGCLFPSRVKMIRKWFVQHTLNNNSFTSSSVRVTFVQLRCQLKSRAETCLLLFFIKRLQTNLDLNEFAFSCVIKVIYLQVSFGNVCLSVQKNWFITF